MAQERHDLLMKLFKLMQENSEDLARLLVRVAVLLRASRSALPQTLENGKTLMEAKVYALLSFSLNPK